MTFTPIRGILSNLAWISGQIASNHQRSFVVEDDLKRILVQLDPFPYPYLLLPKCCLSIMTTHKKQRMRTLSIARFREDLQSHSVPDISDPPDVKSDITLFHDIQRDCASHYREPHLRRTSYTTKWCMIASKNDNREIRNCINCSGTVA